MLLVDVTYLRDAMLFMLMLKMSSSYIVHCTLYSTHFLQKQQMLLVDLTCLRGAMLFMLMLKMSSS